MLTASSPVSLTEISHTEPASGMSLGRPAAGKTGTTDNNTAVWFAGYTPDLAAAVWAGHPDAPSEYPMRDVTINGTYYSEVFGRSIPGPIWRLRCSAR